MVKAEAGRPGPYCLGRLILRHRIDAKRCSIDPTRSRHTASARPRGGGVYDPHQIDRRRRSPKGKKSTRSRSFVRRQAPAFITHTDGASISARGSLPFRSVPAHYQSVAPRGAEAATQGQCRERCAGCRPARTGRVRCAARHHDQDNRPISTWRTGAYLCGAGLRL